MSSSDNELLKVYLDAFQNQLAALRNSARWKVGDKLIRFIEKILGRKPQSLALDHMEKMITQLREVEFIRPRDNTQSIDKLSFTSDLELNSTTHNLTSCGLVVSDKDVNNAIAGDVFTAWELAQQLQNIFDWKVELIDAKTPSQQSFDISISMLHGFNIQRLNSHGYKAAWVRSYAEYWIMKPWFESFDFILCSSKKIQDFLRVTTNKPAFYFPIATNPDRFTDGVTRDNFKADYSFCGSYWNEERKLAKWLNPELLPYLFKVFGKNWEKNKSFQRFHHGQVRYSEMTDIYASSRLILDDANASTTKWESVNSRVFDVLGLGKLLLTNNVLGVSNLFEHEVATYNSADELHDQINYLLNTKDHPNLQSIQQEVLANHTYANRARTLAGITELLYGQKLKIAIKISVSVLREAHAWGDFHFASSLSAAIKKWGHQVRIDCKPNWYEHTEDDINIVLRGIHEYEPTANTLNIMWMISHPSKIDHAECNKYDHVFVASKPYADSLRLQVDTSVSTLLQCTDPNVFYPSANSEIPSQERLYVANSKGKTRKAAQFAIKKNLALNIYGEDWEGKIPDSWILSNHIPNSLLRFYYSSAKFVINDHWDDMLDHGFVSNRVFDVLACNGNLLTDQSIDLGPELNAHVSLYQNADDFERAILSSPPSTKPTSKLISKSHSFDSRAKNILDKINELISKK